MFPTLLMVYEWLYELFVCLSEEGDCGQNGTRHWHNEAQFLPRLQRGSIFSVPSRVDQNKAPKCQWWKWNMFLFVSRAKSKSAKRDLVCGLSLWRPLDNISQNNFGETRQHPGHATVLFMGRMDPFNLPVSCLCPVSNPSNQLTPRRPLRSVFLTSVLN